MVLHIFIKKKGYRHFMAKD